jgi:hypothetical protein
MSKIPLKYHKKVLFYTKYTHPTLICRRTDGRTDGRTHGRTDARMENIYSIFRDKLLLLGEHGFKKTFKVLRKPFKFLRKPSMILEHVIMFERISL